MYRMLAVCIAIGRNDRQRRDSHTIATAMQHPSIAILPSIGSSTLLLRSRHLSSRGVCVSPQTAGHALSGRSAKSPVSDCWAGRLRIFNAPDDLALRLLPAQVATGSLPSIRGGSQLPGLQTVSGRSLSPEGPAARKPLGRPPRTFGLSRDRRAARSWPKD